MPIYNRRPEMVGYQAITSFPMTIDRNVFGAWLSGFVAGEGSFSLTMRRDCPRAAFNMQLRSDDAAVLHLIQSYWMCGGVYLINRKDDGRIRNQAVSLTVYKHEHLETILIPHFEMFPLFAKKARDFDWWKKGVRLVCLINKRKRHKCGTSGQWGRSRKWLPEEIEEFKLYHDEIRDVRSRDVKKADLRHSS